MKRKLHSSFRSLAARLRSGGRRARSIGFLLGLLYLFSSTLFLSHLAVQTERKSSDVGPIVEFKPKPVSQVTRVSPPKVPPPPKVAPPQIKLSTQGSSFGLKSFENQFSFLREGGLTGDQLVMTEDTVDQPPKRRGNMTVEYPPAARSQGIQGFVLLNLLINSEGRVEKAEIKQSQPSGVFDSFVLGSARGWTFEPARYQGRAVATWIQQNVRFNLN